MPRTAHSHFAGFYRLGKSNVPHRLTPAERRRIEELVSALIDILDEEDGDPDLEPSLGWSKTYATTRFDILPEMVDLEEG